MRILVIDVGGTHVKALATGARTPVKIESGPAMSAADMVRAVRDATAHWSYDVISIGYPGPIRDGRPAREPFNLAPGWVGYDFAAAFERPVKIINDAAMQALGSYDGGRMLFLGLGTGLGSALVLRHDVVVPLELAHMPYRKGHTYEDYLGRAGLERLGKKRWRRHVARVVAIVETGLQADYTVLGGGNAKLLRDLPDNARLGANRNAFRGGYRLWRSDGRLRR